MAHLVARFSAEEEDELVRLIQACRRNKKHKEEPKIDRQALVDQISGLLEVVGIAHGGTEFSAAFLEFADGRRSPPAGPGAPPKIDRHTLLRGLADIFVEFSEQDCGAFEVPHAVQSHFIRFVQTAIGRFFGPAGVSLEALSTMWRDLKRAHGKPRLGRPKNISLKTPSKRLRKKRK